MAYETHSSAPLVVFTYNRYKHTELLFESLNHLSGADKTDLFLFSDGPRSKSDENSVQQVRTLLYSYKQNNPFKSVTIIENEVNKGLANSVISGVSDIIERYGEIIVLEDDLVVEKGFLDYMNGALTYYRSNDKVWSVSGYSFPMEGIKMDVYFSGRPCSWGWATWADRWNMVDWKVNIYSSFRRNLCERRSFGSWGADMPDMLDRCMLGDIHSWAIRWSFCAWKSHMFTVYPKDSFVINNGTDGSGTNFKKVEHGFDTSLKDNENPVSYVEPYYDDKIRKFFRTKNIRFLHYCKILLRVSINQFRYFSC